MNELTLEQIPHIKTNKAKVIASIVINGRQHRFESDYIENPKRELSVGEMLKHLPDYAIRMIGGIRPPELFIKVTTNILIRDSKGKYHLNEPI